MYVFPPVYQSTVHTFERKNISLKIEVSDMCLSHAQSIQSIKLRSLIIEVSDVFYFMHSHIQIAFKLRGNIIITDNRSQRYTHSSSDCIMIITNSSR